MNFELLFNTYIFNNLYSWSKLTYYKAAEAALAKSAAQAKSFPCLKHIEKNLQTYPLLHLYLSHLSTLLAYG